MFKGLHSCIFYMVFCEHFSVSVNNLSPTFMQHFKHYSKVERISQWRNSQRKEKEEVDFTPQRSFGMSEDILSCHNWKGVCFGHLMGRNPGILLNLPGCTRVSPLQKICWSKMPVVLRLRDWPQQCLTSFVIDLIHPSISLNAFQSKLQTLVYF